MAGHWIAGDIPGMEAMGASMSPAAKNLDAIVSALGRQADALVGDAGWKGDAATAFRKAWAGSSMAAGALGSMMTAVGRAVGDLGQKLAQIDGDLHAEAAAAQARGVRIDQRTGAPLPLVITGDANAPATKAARQAQTDYTTIYQQAQQLAQGYRVNAAAAVNSAIAPAVDGDVVPPDQRVTIADYVKGLWMIPDEKNRALARDLPASIDAAKKDLAKSRNALRAAKKAYQAKGLKLPKTDPASLTHSAALHDLNKLQTELDTAETKVAGNPMGKIFNSKLGEVADRLTPGLASSIPKELDFLKDVPVIDVAASGVAAEFQAQDDIDKGWSGTEARVKDYGAAAIGLAGGAALTAGGAALAGAAGVTAPVWLTAAVGGVAVVGVGDVAYDAFHQHWSEDVHNDGVVDGFAEGIGGSFKDAGSDMWTTAKDVGSLAKGVWHSLF